MNGAVGLAGFVLVGGQSSRMGTHKALLSYNGCTLAQHIAGELGRVAHCVTLVGDATLYGYLGYPVINDMLAGQGPLSGMEAALNAEIASEWNLIVACDMPRTSATLFEQIYLRAMQAAPEIDCVVPETNGKLQPLCAIYRRGCRYIVTRALQDGTRRVVDVVRMLQADIWPVEAPFEEADRFQNVNTGPEWTRFLEQQQTRH